MASKALASPLIRNVVTRGYAQAATAAKTDFKLQSTILANQTFIAALDNGSPVTRVTVAFKAGSRYESQAELGISHVLRSAAGLTTKNATSFMISRKLAQIGAAVSASGDRELVYYTLEATQENIDEAIEYLSHMISNQEFRPWELSDNNPRLHYDLASLPPQVRAVDLLHKAAYRRGLGNSLFISPRMIGKISSESLQHYATNHVTPDGCAIVLVGDTQERACQICQSLQIGAGTKRSSQNTVYYGGQMRKEMGGDLAHVALAVQGAGAGTPQALALAVAAKALGSGPVTKWGTDNSPLARAVGNIGPFAAAGFNVSYSDSGLFGVVLTVPKDEAEGAVKTVADVLRKGCMSPEDIKIGKNQLKLQILSEMDDGSYLAESIAAQGLYTGAAKNPMQVANEIEKLSDNDIMSAIGNVIKCPLSMGAAGNLAFVPYLDEL